MAGKPKKVEADGEVSDSWQALAKEELALKPLWAALTELDPRGPLDVLDVAQRRKVSPWQLAAEGLRLVVDAYRKEQLGALPRVKLLGDTMAKSYAEEIRREVARALGAKDQWVSLNLETRVVSRHATHPGNRAKVVLLDVRAPVAALEWLDTSGTLTARSVLARLLGYARPQPRPGETGTAVSLRK